MGNPLIPRDIDDEVAAVLASLMETRGVGLRELSRRSEVKLTRLGDILRRGRAMTVGELEALCSVFGISASSILAQVEERLGWGLAALEPGYDYRAEAEAEQELP